MADESTDPHKFVFELDRAISAQVLDKLAKSPPIPLEKNAGAQAGGVYALYRNKKLVYVGKASPETTKSKRTLRGRLNEHITKITGRSNISLAQMTVRYLTIDSDWFIWAAENALINSLEPEWNHSGG